MQFTYELEDDVLGAIDVDVTVEGLVVKDGYDLDDGRVVPFVDVEFNTFEVKFNGEVFELTSEQEMYLKRYIDENAVNYA